MSDLTINPFTNTSLYKEPFFCHRRSYHEFPLQHIKTTRHIRIIGHKPADIWLAAHVWASRQREKACGWVWANCVEPKPHEFKKEKDTNLPIQLKLVVDFFNYFAKLGNQFLYIYI